MMRAAGVEPLAINLFSHHYRELVAGATGMAEGTHLGECKLQEEA